ncbi:MerR family transcriptional regulator, partial [Staphylococcus epidermidis]
MKKRGMQLKDIKQYIDWRTAGDETLDQRLALIQQRRQMLANEIESLQVELTKLDHKEWYYTKALE